MYTPLAAVVAAPEDTTTVGQGVTIGVPIIIIFILFYLVTHKGYKMGGLILAFVAGVMLSGTAAAGSLSQLVESVVNAGVNGVTDVFK
ncbi:hypothetical protein [Yinghuangia seranimata]|uniref:hypothetical protein n=1 Tax=Yinghuangia seranimata TaxID=408067 RepID=UPI00248BA096|nr:hypothetical protein [Yinghuangia seranimata]MDI2130848.1 hypothetical protein [Yinghuangia seranimata]